MKSPVASSSICAVDELSIELPVERFQSDRLPKFRLLDSQFRAPLAPPLCGDAEQAFRQPSFQTAKFLVRRRGLAAAAWAVFFRRLLDTEERFDTSVHYCRCGHDEGRERSPLLQESH